jgi:hypothetical protein
MELRGVQKPTAPQRHAPIVSKLSDNKHEPDHHEYQSVIFLL